MRITVAKRGRAAPQRRVGGRAEDGGEWEGGREGVVVCISGRVRRMTSEFTRGLIFLMPKLATSSLNVVEIIEANSRWGT